MDWQEFARAPVGSNRSAAARRKAKQKRGHFVTFDGESFTVDGRHWYAMIGCSTGDYVYDPDGLSTFECIDFLLRVRRKTKGAKYNGFAFNYDINMMLRDIDILDLRKLWTTGECLVRLDDGATYKLEWIPNKTFRILRLYDKLSLEISDCWGFFQSSFVRALEAWNIPDEDGAIARMKQERANFKPEDWREVLSYCLSECRLLVRLMRALESALDEARLIPARWNGAGAVAAALLQRERVADHKVDDLDYPEPVYDAIMRSYFGGRVEVFQQGSFPEVVNYDIRSAYPYEAQHLPTLVGGHFHHTTVYNPSRFALWRVRWDIPPDCLVMPFPFRKKQAITYPSTGEGWYHASEVAAALKYYPEHIQVIEGYTFSQSHDFKPFSFIPAIFAERAELKAKGSAAEKALKLGLNSLYGKTAQGIGYKGKTPKFRSFYWAGAITAGTRARMFDLAMRSPGAAISIATDGIVFDAARAPRLETGTELGELERSEWERFFIAQPGIYRAFDGEYEIKKSRGFFLKEIDFDDLERGWKEDGPYYQQTQPTKRFIGLGTALHRNRLDTWGTWPDGTRVLSLYSSRKFYASEQPPTVRLLPPLALPGLSDAYTPKTRGIEDDAPESTVQGFEQPRF